MINSGTGGRTGLTGMAAGAAGAVSTGGVSRIMGETAQEKKTETDKKLIQMVRCNFFMVVFLVIIFGF